MSIDPLTMADFFADVNQRLDKIENNIARAALDRPMTTRERIRRFHLAFGVQVNDSWTDMDVATRELRGNLLLEEAVEYITKGLGLRIIDLDGDPTLPVADRKGGSSLRAVLDEGERLDPIECVDGLADVNVVIHGSAHTHGFNLDKATAIADDSNMSKLDPHGLPIINGVTVGYAQGDPGYDSTKPIGKILKGPDFYPPTAYLSELIATAGNNSEDS
jgi:predicted HAD superfamily Cof-like phosphohydrolase